MLIPELDGTIEDQLRQVRMADVMLKIYSADYSIGPVGRIRHQNGDISPVIVLHYKGRSKGAFYSLRALIDAIADSRLQANLRQAMSGRH